MKCRQRDHRQLNSSGIDWQELELQGSGGPPSSRKGDWIAEFRDTGKDSSDSIGGLVYVQGGD